MRINKDKKGFTLLEMLLVLIIIVAIILVAGRYYDQASEASKLSDVTSKVRRIIEASYEWVKVAITFDAKDPNKNTLSTTTLKDEQLLSPNDDVNPWGGVLKLKSLSTNKIQITIPSIPTNSCYLLKKDHLDPQNMLVTCPKSGVASATVDYPADAT
jgi:prepilin-type N-terminal cleavage/methylation domain-containing protein